MILWDEKKIEWENKKWILVNKKQYPSCKTIEKKIKDIILDLVGKT